MQRFLYTVHHLPPCRSKPVKASFVFGTQFKIFWMKTTVPLTAKQFSLSWPRKVWKTSSSPPSSVAIGGNCVCVLSSLVCNLYRLLVASLTAGLNIIPITEHLSVMSRESSRGNVSGYYRNLGSLRAGTRHHGGRRARCTTS